MMFRLRIRPKAILGNEKGLAVVEFFLMLPMLVVIMMFLLIVYEYNTKQVTALQELRYSMRKSIDDNAPAPFHSRVITRKAFVDIPGRMKTVMGSPFIKQSLSISFYEGCYQGLGKNKYRMRYLYREVKQ